MRNFVMCLVMVVGLVSNVFAQGSIPARNGHGAWTSYTQAKAAVDEVRDVLFTEYTGNGSWNNPYNYHNRYLCIDYRDKCGQCKSASIYYQSSSLSMINSISPSIRGPYQTRYDDIQGRVSSNSDFSSRNIGFTDAQTLEINAECAYDLAVSVGDSSQENLELLEDAFINYVSADGAYGFNMSTWGEFYIVWLGISIDAAVLKHDLELVSGGNGP